MYNMPIYNREQIVFTPSYGSDNKRRHKTRITTFVQRAKIYKFAKNTRSQVVDGTHNHILGLN